MREPIVGALTVSVVCLFCFSGCQDASSQLNTASIRQTNSSSLVYDLDGRQVDPLSFNDEKAKVFVFTQMDCPIAIRYAPLISKLQERYEPKGIEFYLVYPDSDETSEIIRSHMKEYSYNGSAFRDPDHNLVGLAGVEVTPEAAVLLPDGSLAYSGRIDNQWADFGKPRVEPTSHELEDAIEAVLAGRAVDVTRVKGVGCYISDLKR